MRLFIISVLLFLGLSVNAQTYTVNPDTTSSCLLEFKQGDLIRVSFKLDEIRYIEASTGLDLIIFDGVQTIAVRASRLNGYNDISALKNDIDRWAVFCGQ